jgi:hypothetical protein
MTSWDVFDAANFISVSNILAARGPTWPVVRHALLAFGVERVPQYGAFHEDNMKVRTTPLFCSLWILLALCASARAQTAPASTISATSSLSPVAWFVGGTWTADVKDPQDGSVTHVATSITWAPNHAAIQFVTTFDGKPHYYGFYAYDPTKQSINFYYTSENGQLTIGTSTPDPDGKTLHQEFDTMQPNGKTVHLKSTIVRDGNDTYHFEVFMQQNGDWKSVLQITYQRKA